MSGFLRGLKDKVTNVLLTPGSTINDNPPDDRDYDDDYDDRDYDDYDDYDDRDYDDRYDSRDRRGYSRSRDYGRGNSSRTTNTARRPWQEYTRTALDRGGRTGDYDEPAGDADAVGVVIRHPRTVNDCPHIIRSLYENNICVVSVVDVDPKDARRIVDFLCGASQSPGGGKIRKISENLNVYVMTPPGVNIDLQEFKRDLERNEMYRSVMYPRDRRDFR